MPFQTLRLGHPRVLPLPTAAFDHLEPLLDPGPIGVPARVASPRRQVGQQQPRRVVTGFPAGQQRTIQRRGAGFVGPAHAGVTCADVAGEIAQLVEMTPALGPKLAPRLTRISGCQPCATMLWNKRGDSKPRSVSTSTSQWRPIPCWTQSSRAHLCGCHGSGCWPWRIFQATGIANPR